MSMNLIGPSKPLLDVAERVRRSPHPEPDSKKPGKRQLTDRQVIARLEGEIAFRELLIEEVIHRTKNELQLAVAIMGEEMETAHDPWLRFKLRSVQKQFAALSGAHHICFGSFGSSPFGLPSSLSGLCSSIHSSFGERGGRIKLSLAVAEIPLRRHQDLCVRLVVQELLSNAFKHAFPCGRAGTIDVRLSVENGTDCSLIVRDDGVGTHPHSSRSTGLTLVEAFAYRLGGGVTINGDHGTAVKMTFPIFDQSVGTG